MDAVLLWFCCTSELILVKLPFVLGPHFPLHFLPSCVRLMMASALKESIGGIMRYDFLRMIS